MRLRHLPLLCLIIFLGGCHGPEVQSGQLATGPWRMVLDLDTAEALLELPFKFDLEERATGWRMVIHNQDEAIAVDSIVLQRDSIKVRLPFFDSEFLGIIKDARSFQGLWYNHYKGPLYAIPFMATAGETPRFTRQPAKASIDIAGDWEVHFISGEDEPAIGIFSMDGNRVKGSFATETGDLRFLEGITTGDSLFLSTFNGFQAYLFRAALRNDSIVGEFRSGHRWKQPWYGVRNPEFKLADDETLTTLDPGVPVAFSFPDVDGHMHALTDEQFRGKAMLVEIMGTWCPNCMDQSRLVDELYEKFNGEGLAAVALCFERYPETARSLAAIRHFKERLGISYSLLYAGMAIKDTVALKLPFIRELKSYPTTLLIGRDGTVRHIYTGIYGPGTGARYLRFRDRLENAIVDLLREPGQE